MFEHYLLEFFHSAFVHFGIVDDPGCVDIRQIDKDQITIVCPNYYQRHARMNRHV